MIDRYINSEIEKYWSNEFKLQLWQKTELAVINAMEVLGKVPQGVYSKTEVLLKTNQINIQWWLNKEKEIRHDLNAFILERMRFLPPELQSYFHKNLTSYDTEEPAFTGILSASSGLVDIVCSRLIETMKSQAVKYRYTIMNGRTHGQEAVIQSFGKRWLTWIQAFNISWENMRLALDNLVYSKLSGAVGNYGSIDPDVEKKALEILGFRPFYGATQIMPRELYAPLAQSLYQIVETLNKIALDIRLGARSGNPICREPFGKKQTGSSAMPHKKNTISCEQIEGMARLAEGDCLAIMRGIQTWEERAIEQSCVERVAWPDLFHIVMHCLSVMDKVLSGLVVCPQNMLREIVESRGTYASSEAKEFLKELGSEHGLSAEDAYKIVQLATFNVFNPNENEQPFSAPLESFSAADSALTTFSELIEKSKHISSIREIIPLGKLKVSDELDIAAEQVNEWNELLSIIFNTREIHQEWLKIFTPSFLLRNEEVLYEQILGI